MDKVRLDHGGIGAILRGLHGPIDALAAAVAANVDVGTTGAPVTVTSGTSDRARATVTIAHPAGLALQAKHGSLTRAAASVGLEVKSR